MTGTERVIVGRGADFGLLIRGRTLAAWFRTRHFSKGYCLCEARDS